MDLIENLSVRYYEQQYCGRVRESGSAVELAENPKQFLNNSNFNEDFAVADAVDLKMIV
jgi:hypothetical protein